MNALIDKDFIEKVVPRGLLKTDVNILALCISAMNMSVENATDVNDVRVEVARIKKLFSDYYEAAGKLDAYNKEFADEISSNEAYNVSERYISTVEKAESQRGTYKVYEPTGDVEKDANTFMSKFIDIVDKVQEPADFLIMQDEFQEGFGKFLEKYGTGPEADKFNEIAEKLSAEMGLEKHQADAQARAEKVMKVITDIDFSKLIEI